MFKARRIESCPDWSDSDNIKIYTISAHDRGVDRSRFSDRLASMKASLLSSWESTPAFAIFHDGATNLYLVLAWWGNDNELFTAVSVQTDEGWVDDPLRYSFCLWDLEVMWHERQFFIDHVYRVTPDLSGYRSERFSNV